MSKQGTTLDPFEEHPEHPRPNNVEAKDKGSFTREDVTHVISKLVKLVENQPAPLWGFKKRDLIENLESILPKLEKIKNEREDTRSQQSCYGEFEVTNKC